MIAKAIMLQSLNDLVKKSPLKLLNLLISCLPTAQDVTHPKQKMVTAQKSNCYAKKVRFPKKKLEQETITSQCYQ